MEDAGIIIDVVKNFNPLGVKVASNSDGVYLGDERLDPIFAELNARKALVIIHPSPSKFLPREGVVTGKVMAMYEYPADTTRAVLNLIANGTLKKISRHKICCASLRFIFAVYETKSRCNVPNVGVNENYECG